MLKIYWLVTIAVTIVTFGGIYLTKDTEGLVLITPLLILPTILLFIIGIAMSIAWLVNKLLNKANIHSPEVTSQDTSKKLMISLFIIICIPVLIILKILLFTFLENLLPQRPIHLIPLSELEQNQP